MASASLPANVRLISLKSSRVVSGFGSASCTVWPIANLSLGKRRHCVYHKINRHQVQTNLAVADVDCRKQRRPFQDVMDQIVYAVILHCFAGFRISADHRWTVNRDRQLRLQLLNFKLRQILCLLVEVAKPGRVAKLILINNAGALSRDVTGRNIVILTAAAATKGQTG